MAGIIAGYNFRALIPYRRKVKKGARLVKAFIEFLMTDFDSEFKEESVIVSNLIHRMDHWKHMMLMPP